jgi:predicted short-subunit dehydrogenase-like oxidoreductase (DUF2520 family)
MTAALGAVGGYEPAGLLRRGDDPSRAADGVDLLILATPDDQVAGVAARIAPVPSTLVLHLSGALGLDALAPHPRRGSLHPLVPLPTPEVAAERLRSGISFAVAGDPAVSDLVEALGGRAFAVDDDHRTEYHAAAAIAANHLVALVGQVERVAAVAGLPLSAFAGLLRAATEDALSLSPADALTGPAARGDWETVERHRRALARMAGARTELAAYDAMVGLARRLSVGVSAAGDAAPATAPAGSVATPLPGFGAEEQVA